MNWRNRAYSLYYNNKLNIIEIASLVGVSKQSVSKYLRTYDLEKYEKEKQRRKEISKEKAKLRRQEWKRKERSIESLVIKRQHEIDVMVLSCDRFF